MFNKNRVAEVKWRWIRESKRVWKLHTDVVKPQTRNVRIRYYMYFDFGNKELSIQGAPICIYHLNSQIR